MKQFLENINIMFQSLYKIEIGDKIMKKILSKNVMTIFIIILFIELCFLSVLGVILPVEKNQEIKTSLSPGDNFRFLNVGGYIRSYRIHIPPSYENGNPLPIVFVLHGSGVPAINSNIIT